jgi:hypothetical protein
MANFLAIPNIELHAPDELWHVKENDVIEMRYPLVVENIDGNLSLAIAYDGFVEIYCHRPDADTGEYDMSPENLSTVPLRIPFDQFLDEYVDSDNRMVIPEHLMSDAKYNKSQDHGPLRSRDQYRDQNRDQNPTRYQTQTRILSRPDSYQQPTDVRTDALNHNLLTKVPDEFKDKLGDLLDIFEAQYGGRPNYRQRGLPTSTNSADNKITDNVEYVYKVFRAVKLIMRSEHVIAIMNNPYNTDNPYYHMLIFDSIDYELKPLIAGNRTLYIKMEKLFKNQEGILRLDQVLFYMFLDILDKKPPKTTTPAYNGAFNRCFAKFNDFLQKMHGTDYDAISTTIANDIYADDIISFVKFRTGLTNTENTRYMNTISDNKFLKVEYSDVNESLCTIPAAGADYICKRPPTFTYTHEFEFGPFTGIFKCDIKNDAIHKTESFRKNITDKLTNGEPVCIIGYGPSGSGKTSTLVRLDIPDKKQEPGVLLNLATEFAETGKYNQCTLDIYEISTSQTFDQNTPKQTYICRLDTTNNKWISYTKYGGKTRNTTGDLIEKIKKKYGPTFVDKDNQAKREEKVAKKLEELNINTKINKHKTYKCMPGEDNVSIYAAGPDAIIKQLQYSSPLVDDLGGIILEFMEDRETAATLNNPDSSRSHAIFGVRFEHVTDASANATATAERTKHQQQIQNLLDSAILSDTTLTASIDRLDKNIVDVTNKIVNNRSILSSNSNNDDTDFITQTIEMDTNFLNAYNEELDTEKINKSNMVKYKEYITSMIEPANASQIMGGTQHSDVKPATLILCDFAGVENIFDCDNENVLTQMSGFARYNTQKLEYNIIESNYNEKVKVHEQNRTHKLNEYKKTTRNNTYEKIFNFPSKNIIKIDLEQIIKLGLLGNETNERTKIVSASTDCRTSVPQLVTDAKLVVVSIHYDDMESNNFMNTENRLYRKFTKNTQLVEADNEIKDILNKIAIKDDSVNDSVKLLLKTICDNDCAKKITDVQIPFISGINALTQTRYVLSIFEKNTFQSVVPLTNAQKIKIYKKFPFLDEMYQSLDEYALNISNNKYIDNTKMISVSNAILVFSNHFTDDGKMPYDSDAKVNFNTLTNLGFYSNLKQSNKPEPKDSVTTHFEFTIQLGILKDLEIDSIHYIPLGFFYFLVGSISLPTALLVPNLPVPNSIFTSDGNISSTGHDWLTSNHSTFTQMLNTFNTAVADQKRTNNDSMALQANLDIHKSNILQITTRTKAVSQLCQVVHFKLFNDTYYLENVPEGFEETEPPVKPSIKETEMLDLCKTRGKEGEYINQTIDELRLFISNLITGSQSTKTPKFNSECLPVQCNPSIQNCFGNDLYPTSESSKEPDIYKQIAMVLNDYLTRYGSSLKELKMCVFCVINLDPNANNPPPAPYIDISFLIFFNDLLDTLNKFKTYDKYIEHIGRHEAQCKDEINKIMKNTLLKEFQINYNRNTRTHAENSKPLVSEILSDEIINNCKYLLHPDTKLYNSKKIFENIIKTISSINSVTVIGALQFTDSISKFGLSDGVCNTKTLETLKNIPTSNISNNIQSGRRGRRGRG